MDLMNKLKSYQGKGTPTGVVTISDTEVAPKEKVKGKVTIAGGEYNTEIDKLNVYFWESRFEKEKQQFNETKKRIAKLTMNDYLLEPEENITVPFMIEIPKDTSPSADTLRHKIMVEIDVSGKSGWAEADITII